MKPVQLLDFDSVQDIVWAVSYPLTFTALQHLEKLLDLPSSVFYPLLSFAVTN